MVRCYDNTEWLTTLFKSLNNCFDNTSVKIFNCFYLSLHTALMSHFVRCFNMDICKIITIFRKCLNCCIGFAFIICMKCSVCSGNNDIIHSGTYRYSL